MARGQGHGGGGSERWRFTYADLITLLMVFVIVLYALSEVDKEKYRQAASSLGRIFTGSAGVRRSNDESGRAGTEAPPPGVTPAAPDDLAGIAQPLHAAFVDDRRFAVLVTERGLVLSLPAPAFDSGSAAIKPELVPVLESLAERIRSIPNDISIEGFADPDPIATPEFRSNWDLSIARANAVRSVLEVRGVVRERMVVVGYGATRPVFTNDSPEGKARNRRVEIVILRHRQVDNNEQEINRPMK